MADTLEIACPTCTYLNSHDRSDCEVCGSCLDPEVEEQTNLALCYIGGGSLENVRTAVPCPMCTVENDPSRYDCSVCGSCLDPEVEKKTNLALCGGCGKGSASMSISCPACTYANDISRTDCKTCGAVLYPKEGRNPGDLLPENTEGFIYYMCPHGCGMKSCVKETEINCTIFICGINDQGVQVNQHNEAAAATLKAQGKLTGCGMQYRWDTSTQKMIVCTGR